MSLCNVCKTPTSTRCARCAEVYYCSRDHQKSDWKQHKKHCCNTANGSDQANNQSGRSVGVGDGLRDAVEGKWHQHVPQQFHYEWFTNCYQLRCDDDYAWGGCNLHGPYDPDADVDSITMDFLAFCLLARKNEAVPADWNWTSFLKTAGKFAGFAFEKSDANERWGSGMTAMLMRITAEKVYGSSCQAMDSSEDHQEADEHASVPLGRNRYLNEVGGKAAWNGFKSSLRSKRAAF